MSEPVDTSAEAVLVRFGLQWNGPREFVSTPMADGYWTPWHVAHSALTAARNDKLALTGMLQQSRVALTAAQQRIAELDAALSDVASPEFMTKYRGMEQRIADLEHQLAVRSVS